MVRGPDGQRFFVGEEKGKIWSFPDRQDVERADLVIGFQLAGRNRAHDLIGRDAIAAAIVPSSRWSSSPPTGTP